MKKTIRLTESELINLVQRIIKEDEMMGDMSSEMTSTRPTGCRTNLKKLAKENSVITNFPNNTTFIVSEIKGSAKLIKSKIAPGQELSEPIFENSKVGTNQLIELKNGTNILFNDISGFGQATVECNNGKSKMSVSTE